MHGLRQVNAIMKLIITRHGQTEGNIKRILSDVDDELSLKGKEQAKKLSSRLKEEHIDLIVSSPIKRAKETAEQVAKFHPEAKFILADELKEMELGSYLNKGFDEVDWVNIPSDVESRTSMFNRIKILFEKVYLNYSDKTVLFVAHNALNKSLIRFLRSEDSEDRKAIPQDNTAITIFEIKGELKNELVFNSTSHL